MSVRHVPRKSNVLSRSQIDEFLLNAPDDVFLLIKVVIAFGVFGAYRRQELHDLCFNDVKVEGSVLVPQLITKYGYPVETHTILTEDGYFLTLHRIPYGQQNTSKPRHPVMLQHGILCSSADWIILGPGKSLAYVLADEGYDVWMGNARGNTYSRKHLNYTTANSKFWDYSFHEMGVFDLPVVTDYILKTTDHKCLKYIGHSMGITMFLIFLSEHPEYNDKFCIMIGLAPVAYISHAPTPIRDFSVSNGMEGVMKTLELFGIHDILRNSDFTVEIAKNLCKEIVLAKLLCENILQFAGGFGTNQLNTDVTALYKALPNVIGNFRVPLTQFNHLDFLWGTDAKILVYDKVVEIFKQMLTKINEV
ncbi:hypothetical protein C0J52_01607 [Blattella germanica]|nr:hypothetical protein C0J52_01607 [Blattella germanica]